MLLASTLTANSHDNGGAPPRQAGHPHSPHEARHGGAPPRQISRFQISTTPTAVKIEWSGSPLSTPT